MQKPEARILNLVLRESRADREGQLLPENALVKSAPGSNGLAGNPVCLRAG
jgi:hypothetical protein